jgi:hypothetical protein
VDVDGAHAASFYHTRAPLDFRLDTLATSLLDVSTMTTTARPLDGVRVLELACYQAGPRGGMILSDLGAEVIKIEPPGGEETRTHPPMVRGQSVYFSVYHRGKKSVCSSPPLSNRPSPGGACAMTRSIDKFRPETCMAIDAVKRALTIARRDVSADDITAKGGRDLVTVTDVAVEDAVRRIVADALGFSVVGEERGGEARATRLTSVVIDYDLPATSHEQRAH